MKNIIKFVTKYRTPIWATVAIAAIGVTGYALWAIAHRVNVSFLKYYAKKYAPSNAKYLAVLKDTAGCVFAFLDENNQIIVNEKGQACVAMLKHPRYSAEVLKHFGEHGMINYEL